MNYGKWRRIGGLWTLFKAHTTLVAACGSNRWSVYKNSVEIACGVADSVEEAMECAVQAALDYELEEMQVDVPSGE